MKFLKAVIEVIDALFASDKSAHAGKKVGGALAKRSFKRARRLL